MIITPYGFFYSYVSDVNTITKMYANGLVRVCYDTVPPLGLTSFSADIPIEINKKKIIALIKENKEWIARQSKRNKWWIVDEISGARRYNFSHLIWDNSTYKLIFKIRA
jgi:hypothetical protein